MNASAEPCAKCGGFGFVVFEGFARECRCRRESLDAHSLATIPPRYTGYTRASWPAHWPLPPELDRWAPRPGCSPWAVVLLGRKGTGKTHVGTAFFRESVMRSSHGGAWVDWFEALSQTRNHFASEEQGEPPIVSLMKSNRLVLLDDVGAGRDTAHARELIDGILRHRHLNLLPTILTSNADDLSALESAIDARQVSRLAEDSVVKIFNGRDHRILSVESD